MRAPGKAKRQLPSKSDLTMRLSGIVERLEAIQAKDGGLPNYNEFKALVYEVGYIAQILHKHLMSNER